MPFAPARNGALGSRYGAEFSLDLDGRSDEWANARLAFRDLGPYDASVYAGVEFFAKGNGFLQVRLHTSSDDELTYQTKAFELTSDYRVYQLLFDDPAILTEHDLSRAISLEFEGVWDAPMPFEFAVDDVVLLRPEGSSPPGGSGGGGGQSAGGAAGAAQGGSAGRGAAGRGGQPSTGGTRPSAGMAGGNTPGDDGSSCSGCCCDFARSSVPADRTVVVAALGLLLLVSRRRSRLAR
jgi:hypothetical protein